MKRERDISVPQFVEFPENMRPSDASDSLSDDSLRNGIDTTRVDILDSWKQISSYLGRDVRTVQRWEKHEKLPVHRHIHNAKASVYAFKSEIDAWHKGRSSYAESSCLRQLPPEKNGRVSRYVDSEAGFQVPVTTIRNQQATDSGGDPSVTFVFCIPGSLFGPTVVCLSCPDTASIRGEHQWNGSPRNTKRSI